MFIKHDSNFLSIEGNEGDAGGGGAAQPATSESSAPEQGGESRPALFDSKPEGAKVNISELLGDDLGKSDLFKPFENSENFPKDLAKAYSELHEKASKGVQPLGENATDEEKREFWGKLGVPEDPSGYKFAKPDNWPKDVPYDQAHADAWAQRMHEANVPAETANALRNAFIEEIAAASGESSAELDKMMKESYGDRADVRAKEIGASIKEVFPQDKQIDALMTGLPESALLVIGKLQDHYKAQYGATDDGDDGEGGAGNMTAEELRAEGLKLMQHKAYKDAMHPEHKRVREEARQYYKRAEDAAKMARSRKA